MSEKKIVGKTVKRPIQPAKQPVRVFERFHWVQRIAHVILLTSFSFLGITGLPQKFSTAGWAQAMIHFFGGIETTRLIHHVCAIVLMFLAIYHILDIGYKYDSRDQQYKLLDVNPRIGTTFRLFVDTNGLDVVRTLYCDLTGQQIVQGMTREGRKWVVENFDAVSSVQSLRDGDAGISGWVRSFRGLEETSWFASDDLLPFLAMVWHSLRWLLHRLLKVPSPKDL